MYSVLLIAPRTDLKEVDKETQNVLRSGLNITPLFGAITRQDLIDEIPKGYDIIWFSTHTNEDGEIDLGENLTIKTSDLIPLINEKTKLIFLNSCSSKTIAQQIQNITNCAVICTLTNVGDVLAYQTGSLFAKKLALTNSIEQAYKGSIPGENVTYLFLGSLKSIDLDKEMENKDKDNAINSHDFNELIRVMYKLDATLNAELQVVKARLEALEETKRDIVQALNTPKAMTEMQARYIIYGLFIVSFLLIIGTYFVAKSGG